MHLDEITSRINHAFGEPLPEMGRQDIEALEGILGVDGYRRYLRDQINRQIIRDYLTNAVVLGVISEEYLASFSTDIASEEGRAVLALYMLMSSVEEAGELPLTPADSSALRPLQPGGPNRPDIKLVPT